MNVMAESIKLWAKERNLHNADPYKQILKVGEEFGELCQAIAKDKNDIEIKEEIGDIYITLVILCTKLGYDIDDCIVLAYEKIKNRKGEMVNGIFVKEDDLSEK